MFFLNVDYAREEGKVWTQLSSSVFLYSC